MAHCTKGGAVIHHKVVDGMHRYSIQEVMQCKGVHFPFRVGDQLLEVNEKNVSDFPPETLVEILREKFMLLTFHSAPHKTESAEPGEATGMVYRPYGKKEMELWFTLAMVRMEGNDTTSPPDLKGTDRFYPAPGTPTKPSVSPLPIGGVEESRRVVQVRSEAKGWLMVFNHTTISLVQQRGPRPSLGTTCTECKKKGCDVHVVNVNCEDQSEVYYLEEEVPANDCCGMIMKVMYSDWPFLIHNEREQCLQPDSGHRRIVLSQQNSESAQVTIFYYKTNQIVKPFCGIPVTLKFSKTNCFLMCQSEGPKIVLRIEECTSESLKRIPEGSSKWHFIFYMKERQDGTLSFESARYPGWFINNQWHQDRAEMKRTRDKTLDADFIFILLKV